MDSRQSTRELVRLPPPGTVPEPVTLPESVGSQMSAEELRRRYTDLTSLYNAGADLSSILEWDPLVERTIDAAMRVVHADAASLMILDDRRNSLYIASGRGLALQVLSDTRLEIGRGVAGWVAQNREALLLVGPVQSERFPGFYPKPESISSALCVPLIPPPTLGHAQAVLGVLNLSRRIGSASFEQSDLELATAFSTQAAAALQNARLYKQMERRNTQLQNLIDISRSLTVSLDVDTVLRSIMKKAVELLHAEAGSLLLVDQETGGLIFKIALGPAGEKLADTRLPPGVGIAGAVARDGRPLIIDDARADPRHYPEIDANTDLSTRSLLCVPLVSKEKVIGVVQVMNRIDGTPFQKEDSESLSAFAVQSAIALENAQLYSDLKRAFTDTVRVIANAVAARDPYTSGHINRVTRIALETARELGWNQDQMDLVEIGALLHDIGKIGVADAILRKPDPLTEAEYEEMKQHPVLGARMLEGVSILRPILPYVLYHQERYDGTGYPFGLAGKEIPIEGRLLAVVDSFDAMTSDRPYRRGMPVDRAIEEIIQNGGTQFDPVIVDALVRVLARDGLAA